MRALLFQICFVVIFARELVVDESFRTYYSHTGFMPGDEKLEEVLIEPFPEYYFFFDDLQYPQNCDEMVNNEQKRRRMWEYTQIRNDVVILKSWYLRCWDITQYMRSSIPKQNLLDPNPLGAEVIKELHDWFSQKYEATGEDEYLKYNPLPDYRNYDCKDAYNCMSKTNDDDLKIIQGEIPDYQTNATLLSIADVNNDGYADATVFLESAVHGRVNPAQLLMYTRLPNDKGATVLEIFPHLLTAD